MLSLAWKNLKRDRGRAIVAVIGVVFAVILITVETGMLLGLARNASLLIDQSKADIWISAPNVKTFDFATPFPQRKRFLVEGVPGVRKVEEFDVSVSVWKLPDGSNANCQVIGFEINGELAPELNLVSGDREALHNRDAVIIDIDSLDKLGNPRIGDKVEIIRNNAQIVGLTRGMQSFTTMPLVFTSLDRGSKYGWAGQVAAQAGFETSIYLLVDIEDGADLNAVRDAIQMAVPGVEVHTKADFSWRTRKYWLIETGVGIGFMAAAFLGVLVGGVVVSQSLYGMTVEKIPEYGVLKALGAGMGELSSVVLGQGLSIGAVGLLVGLLLSTMIQDAASSAGTIIEISSALVALVTLLTILLCISASLASIMRLRRVDPASVFRT